jgi:hypothetical protein
MTDESCYIAPFSCLREDILFPIGVYWTIPEGKTYRIYELHLIQGKERRKR